MRTVTSSGGHTGCGQEAPQLHDSCAEWPGKHWMGGCSMATRPLATGRVSTKAEPSTVAKNLPSSLAHRQQLLVPLGTKVGLTLEVSGHLRLCLGANYVLTFPLTVHCSGSPRTHPLSTHRPLSPFRKKVELALSL